MDSAKAFSLPSLFLVVFLAIEPAMTGTGTLRTRDLIENICRSVEDYGFCRQTFLQNLLSPTADLADLTRITILQASTNATNTHDFIRHLLENTTDEAQKSALTECENAYRLVTASFQKAYVCFVGEDYDGVLSNERGTPRAQASCEDTFHTPWEPVNPLAERNREMRILITMAVAAANMLLS